ncbi:MAG: CPBP family intramembrane metalloprotease [Alphaproteobacteria bacterium]|nr:CPBP family intramembrane metalloprotease [Alphaproteobacteria bacterium]
MRREDPSAITLTVDPGPDARAAALGTGMGCLSMLLVGLMVAPFASLLAAVLGGPEQAWALAAALPLQALFLVALAAALAGAPWSEHLGLRRAARWPLVLLVLPAGALADAAVEATRWLAPWAELGAMGDLAEAINAGGLVGPLAAVGAVVFAPLGEELLFRGLILAGLRHAVGDLAAVVGSAAIFGLYHVDPVHAIGAGVLGLWLGWLRLRTGSLIPCVVAHMVNNGLWVAVTWWLPEPPVLGPFVVTGCVAAVFAPALVSRFVTER